MSRAARVIAIATAWTLPVVWVGVALSSGPSDGTVVSPPTVGSTAPGWSDSVTVDRTIGTTSLQTDDVVRTIDGRSWGDWLTGGEAPSRSDGDVLTYGVVRPGGELPVELEVEVRLTDMPVRPALVSASEAIGVAALGLLVGSALVWRRPTAAPHRALLAGASLTACGITTTPLGIAAIDVAGGRGLWPHVGGGIAFAAGLACFAAVAVTLGSPASRPRWAPAALAGPVAGYAVWVLVVALPRPPGPHRWQALLTIAGPAAIGTTAAVLTVLVVVQARARDRSDRLAARLVLQSLIGAVGIQMALVTIPSRLVGQPLVPAGALAAVVVAAAYAGVVAALLHYRLDVLEPAVRRALLQAALVAVVGGAFLASAGVVDRASNRSFESMLAGGMVALLVLPLALGAQRWLRRRLYGDRTLPRHVVAELRRLDPTAAPEEAFRETLTLLADRLRLSYAALEVTGTGPDTALTAAVGQARSTPVTVELVSGGSAIGRLLLEVAMDRDAFGSTDHQLLEDVGAEVGALVQAVLMSTELQRSRQRLITSREEERRRLRRDLHDGLGPSLATMAMRLETARDLVADDPEVAAELIGRLSDQARDEITEVRRLVDGLRPPALDQLGLVSALRLRADEHGLGQVAGRSLRWSVVADDDLEPLPAAVEVAAYRIVVEAVNNVQRHSGAETCEVSLVREGGVLGVRVRDDGRGLADRPGLGVGLTSMRERAEELGGTCTVRSETGVGTVVEARLPLGEEAGP